MSTFFGVENKWAQPICQQDKCAAHSKKNSAVKLKGGPPQRHRNWNEILAQNPFTSTLCWQRFFCRASRAGECAAAIRAHRVHCSQRRWVTGSKALERSNSFFWKAFNSFAPLASWQECSRHCCRLAVLIEVGRLSLLSVLWGIFYTIWSLPTSE